ncbi:MAG: hypothetical protein VW454_05975 [Pelagibacteraceae bacterium]
MGHSGKGASVLGTLGDCGGGGASDFGGAILGGGGASVVIVNLFVS